MNALIPRLEAGLRQLAAASPDGTALRNDVGFSGATLGPGTDLAARIGQWDQRDVLRAWQICRTHNTQLGGDIPPVTAAATAAVLAAVRPPAPVDAAPFDPEVGLKWTAPKLVKLKSGEERVLRKADPTPAFYTAWRTQQARLRAAGYGLSKDNKSGQWVVCHWAPVVDDRRPPLPLDTELVVRDINPAGLRPYQIEAARHHYAFLRRYGGVIDPSDLGTGKTYTSLAVARQWGAQCVLVVAPVATRLGWEQAAAVIGVQVQFYSWEAARNGKQTDWVVWHPALKRFSYTERAGAVIFDEFHRAKNKSTLNCRLVLDAVRQRIPVIGLSGTPFQDATEARAAGAVVALHDGSSAQFYPWIHQFGCAKTRFGFQFIGDDEDNKRLNEVFSARWYRIRKSDPAVAAWFPRREIVVRGFSGDAEQIAELEAEMEAELADLEAAAARDKKPMLALTIRLRRKQKVDLLKVPYVADMVPDLLAQGYSVVLGANFKDYAEALLEALAEYRPAMIVGGMSDAERREALLRFQSRETSVIVVNYQAGSAGLNLQDPTPDGSQPRVTVGPSCSTGALNQTQFWGRTDRSGTVGHCMHYLVGLWDDQYDRAVLDRVNERRHDLSLALDGVLCDDDLMVGLR